VVVPTEQLEAAKRAVAVVFGASGFLLASWVSRLPAVRDQFGLSPARMGMMLFFISVGSVSSLLAAGVVVHWLGPRRAGLISAGLMTVGLSAVSLTSVVPVLAVELALVGVGIAVWDVAMNVEGAGVERLLGRSIMPRYHAGFSLGMVGGAAGGAVAAACHVPVSWHFVTLSMVSFAAVALAVTRYVGPQAWGPVADPEPRSEGEASASSGVLRAWREPRTLRIGLLTLGMGFAEGAANDWLEVGLVDGYGVPHSVAALGLGVFVTAMTLSRFAGPWALDRLGRVCVLRAGALMVAVGVLAVEAGAVVRGSTASPDGLVPALVLAAIGAFVWGVGAALGFPVAMSAASDEPHLAAARVSVVSAIGYVAFLAGPPFLGFLGNRVGVVHALFGVGVAVLLALAFAGSARPPARS
jgi:MFS family permease